MKILHLLHDDLAALASGPARHVHALALAQERLGHAVLVLHGVGDAARSAGAWIEGEVDGVRTLARVQGDATPLTSAQDDPALRARAQDEAALRATWIETRAEHDFAHVLEREQPAVVHVHQLAGFGPRCITVAREHGARVVVTLHDFHALCARGTLARRTPAGGVERCERAGAECTDCLAELVRAAAPADARHSARLAEAQRERRAAFRAGLSQAHVVVAPSRFLLRTYAAAGFLAGATVEVLSLGTSGPLHKPRSRHGGKLRLGFVGDAEPEHGLRVLLDALAQLPRAPLELHVHPTTTWTSAALAELRARAHGLAVEFHGRVPPLHAEAAFASFDVLVVPNLAYENGLAAIGDAFRCGVPVIASELGGTPELVRDGINGLVVPPGDARALARAFTQLLADPGLYDRLGRDRPRLATIGAVAEQLERLYASPDARTLEHGTHAH